MLKTKIDKSALLVTGKANRVEPKTPFYSVFNLVFFDKNTDSVKYAQPACELSIDKYSFPTKENNTAEINFDGVAQLKLALVNQNLADVHVDTLLSLCKRYLWCVPAAKYFDQEADISCFEHIRLVAGLVACGDTENYMLVCGDITGIQKYIYGIGSKGAAKALKGRSFWLNQCVDMSAAHILEKCGLSTANLIYSSGGKFYLLLAKNHKDALDAAKIELENYFYTEYDGDLAIVIASTCLKITDFTENKISEKWGLVNDSLETEKRRKYSSKFKGDFFNPYGFEGSVVQCANTKKDLCETSQLTPRGANTQLYWEHKIPRDGKVDAVIYEPYGEPNGIISKEQYLSIQIGAKLKATNNKALTIFSKNEGEFEILSKSIKIAKEATDSPKLKQHIYFNDFFNLKNTIANKPSTQKFYGGNWEGFDNYEELIKKAKGIARLGVLRMDVDNLGKVFQDGLGKNATFARVVQMSSMLDFFFCGYLNKLQLMRWSIEEGITRDKGEILSDKVQIVYAGGDDVFIIGVWNVLPDIAAWISEKFALFTGGNKSLTISGGISLFQDKYPLYKAANEAGEAEHKAKAERKTKNGQEVAKNAICFLGVTVSFADFEIVRKHTRVLVKAIEAKTLSKSIISRLYQFYADYQGLPDEKGKHTPQLWSKWRWQAAYSLSRYAEQHKAAATEINELKKMLFTSQECEQDFIILSYLIAQWADLLTRKKKDTQDGDNSKRN